MAEASQPVDDDVREVMTLTGVDEATAKKGLEESGGDMTKTINKLLDDVNIEVDVGAPVVKQVMLFKIFTASLRFLFQDNSFPEVEVNEIAEEPTTAQTEEALQTVKSVTGKDEATVKRVLDEVGGDATRAINKLLDLEAEVEVEKVGFSLMVDEIIQIIIRWLCFLRSQQLLK